MKAKRNFIALSFLFISCFGKAQDNTADSLKSLLSAAKQDSNKVKLLLVLSEYYLNSSPEEAKRISLQAFDLAGLLKYPSGQALALKDIGGAYYFLGNTYSALQSFSESMRVYDSLHDLVGKGVILNNIGTVYYQNGSANKALEYYFKSLDIAQKIGDNAGVAAAFTNIGNVYNSKRATRDKALGYYLQALHLSEEIGDKNNLGAVSVNLGEIYFDLNKDDSALFYFQESLMAYANTINIPYPQRDIGRLYAKKGLYSSAIQWEQQSYEMAKKFDSKLDMTQSLKELGDTYFSKGEYNSALHSYKQADSIAAIIPAYKELGEAYGGLAKTYSKLGEFASAYFYQMLFSGVADTLNNQTLADQLTAMQKSYEIQTSQNEIQSLTKDKQLQELDLKSQKIQKAFITAGLVLIFIIAFVIYRMFFEENI